MSRTSLSPRIFVCGLIALFGLPMSAQNPGSLKGSWELTFTPTGSSSVSAIPGLATFTSDGTVVETDATQFVPTPGPNNATPVIFGSPGHGAWQVAPALIDFIVEFESVQASGNGTLHATRTYQLIVTLNANDTQFSGSYAVTATPVSGTPTTISGTVTGKKIQIPPPPVS